MHAAAVAIAEQPRLTWPEIRRACPDQWVVLGALDSDAISLVVRSAVVRGAGPTRREAKANARRIDGEVTHRKYTGVLRNPRPW